jgi:NAD dependent epimerase/dehydratase family enzyme
VVGDGRQYWSWVALDDVVGMIDFCVNHPEISGPVNGVSPNPCTNYDFTKTLGGVLHRPTIVPMPAFAARLALGEMADDLLLGSNRVIPERLQHTGYQFRCPTLDGALRHLLGT